MDLNELRQHVTNDYDESGVRKQVIVAVLLGAALICSLLTPFVNEPVVLPAAAIVFLTLGLLGARSIERRSLRS